MLSRCSVVENSVSDAIIIFVQVGIKCEINKIK